MARKTIPTIPRGRTKPALPARLTHAMRVALYNNSRRNNPVPSVIGDPLQGNTMIFGTTEMSHYG